jgi:DNA topoisomerase VI subunit B
MKRTVEEIQAIMKAERELNAFLEANPKMRELQDKYDAWMKKAGNNPQNRLCYFKEFMRETLMESRQKLLDHVAEFKHAAGISEDSK